jgi:DNA-binding MarR family transcriptional regulator
LQLKTLFLQGIASPATVQRRLNRLCKLGIVRQVRAAHDRRVLNLSIDPKVWKLYEHLGKLMRKAWA